MPDFIRQHLALNGHQPYVGGYFVGSETYIPALDYFTAGPGQVDWKYAFERQWLFYKLWGRLLFDPSTPDMVFASEFTRRYGKGKEKLLPAYALASNTQLRLASLFDSRWDFTLYREGLLALQGEETHYIGVDALIRQPTMDPDYVSVADYVKTLHSGGRFADSRVTPDELADSLERDSRAALALIDPIRVGSNASLGQEVADIRIWAGLGLHLAEKLRGAIALETWRANGDEARKQAAVGHLEKALTHWDEVIRVSRPIYRDMRLTHYNGNAFTANANNLFHWALIRDEVAADVEAARNARR